jgi:hypothetical protein
VDVATHGCLLVFHTRWVVAEKALDLFDEVRAMTWRLLHP